MGWAACLAAFLTIAPVQAQDLPKFDAVGPKKVTVGDNLATIDLPKGYAFYSKANAVKIMEMLGNKSDGSELGLVLSTNKDTQDYMVLVEYEETGHVKDDEKIDKDKLLESMKEGTEAQNEERKEKGIPGLHVTGWEEEPHYEKEAKRVIWAPKASVDGEQGEIVNYNTRVLGRTGVLSLNLMTSMEALPKRKTDAQKILAATSFNEGKKYTDYKDGDKVAEYGLMGLILGGTAVLAKKTGIIALVALFFKKGLVMLLALKKLLIFVVVGFFAGIKSLFNKLTGRKEPVVETPPPFSQDPPPPPADGE